MTSQWSGLVRLYNILNTLWFCLCLYFHIGTKLGKVLIYCKRPLLLKPHDPLIRWPIWGHMTIWKTYISIFTRLTATKLGRVVTSGRRFSTEMLKLPPNFGYFVFISLSQNKFAQMKMFWYFEQIHYPLMNVSFINSQVH